MNPHKCLYDGDECDDSLVFFYIQITNRFYISCKRCESVGGIPKGSQIVSRDEYETMKIINES
jgi:hypothetical protein